MKEKPIKNSNTKFAVLGYDPGGEENNGAAILIVNHDNRISAEVTTKNYVDDTFDWFKSSIKKLGQKTEVRAAGIDTLLSWSTGKSGWRPMDDWIKDWLLNKGEKETEKTRRSILSSNFLQGAMVVQGMAMAIKMREKWKTIILNETHPKVQYYAKSLIAYKKFDEKGKGRRMKSWLRNEISGKMDLDHFPQIRNEHEWDALYSAWVTLQSIQNRSTPDLLVITKSKIPLIFPAGQVNYYWPF